MIDIIIFVLISFICAILLTIVSHFMTDKKDNNLEAIVKMLPGINCGVCGYANCNEMAKALLKDKNNLDKCRPIKKENKDILMEYLMMRKG